MAALGATLREPSPASIEPFCAEQRHEQEKYDGHVPQIVRITLRDSALRVVHVFREVRGLREWVVLAASLVRDLSKQPRAKLGLLDVGPLIVREERARRRVQRIAAGAR